MGTYCWCVHVLQTSTLCEGSGTHRPLLVYRFSAASLHNYMLDSFSLDTYSLSFDFGELRFCHRGVHTSREPTADARSSPGEAGWCA